MKNIETFFTMKVKQEKIVMLTAYDYSSAKLSELCDVDIILVGDSLGMVMQGEETTLHVTSEDIIRYGKSVRKGAPNTFIIADMPYMSYHLDIHSAQKNAADLILQTGANAVKLEGGSVSRIEAVKAIIDCEIPVVAHLGLTPQSINRFGEYSVQAKNKKEQENMIKQALALEEAGAFMLVLECIPEGLGKELTEALHIPTIGIGAGRYTDGQVMVWHDILGLSDMQPKFVKKYTDLKHPITDAIKEYVTEVKTDKFPAKANTYYPK
ncbi:MAG: 3-methyl-2-oxobutanoate hydroxymethyltransferase [Candidatus Cloacimonetes bacterium]|nr:3-methyl-2-oxobutanoate hydroxymethyltransferase [Candidatus Cloacimonadota bacterium]